MKLDEKILIKKYGVDKHRLDHLQPRYLEIFEYRIGLTDGSPHTQEETGKKFDVSGTRIRQIEERVKYELEQLQPNYEQ